MSDLIFLVRRLCYIANIANDEPALNGRDFSEFVERGSSRLIDREPKIRFVMALNMVYCLWEQRQTSNTTSVYSSNDAGVREKVMMLNLRDDSCLARYERAATVAWLTFVPPCAAFISGGWGDCDFPIRLDHARAVLPSEVPGILQM